MEKPVRIGIIYLAVGIYEEFWREFYPSCECFFCPEAEKGYEVFTDSTRIPAMNLKNVNCYHAENRGFIRNASAKSDFVCSIAERLRKSYDYVFYLNANYKFVEPVRTDEVLPAGNNDGLTVLSFDLYRNRPADNHPYDRNPDCHACIPYGKGERYYQSGFYGGETEAFIRLSEWCKIQTEADLSRKVIAKWHDESYVNRYLLNLHPRIINETYGYADYMPHRPYKAILLDKKKYLGERFEKFKDLSIDNSLSFLLDENLNPQKIAIVRIGGTLYEQLFQYAFFLWLRKRLAGTAQCYLSDADGNNILLKTYPAIRPDFVSEDMNRKIANANPLQIEHVKIDGLTPYVPGVKCKKAITVYEGKWIDPFYVEEVKDEWTNVFGCPLPDMEQTARHFLFFGSYLRNIGLFDGKMGLMIFLFHYARHSGNSLYEDFAMELFEDIGRDISVATPVGLGNGLCGIGWGILYLSQNGFIEDNTNEILEEIDERIMEYDLARMKDLSLENGFQGIALYLTERLKDLSSPYDTNYRMEFERKCTETGWQAPVSPSRTIGEAMLEKASPFPAVSTCCWQKELFKLFAI